MALADPSTLSIPTTQRRGGLADGLVASIPPAALLLTLVGMVLHLAGDEKAMFLIVAGMPLTACTLPLLWRRFRQLDMWTFAIISIGIGYTLTLFYVYQGNPSEKVINDFFLLGESPVYFLYPTVLVSAGLTMMSLGYVASSGKQMSGAANLGVLQVRRRRLYFVTGLFALFSLISFVLFVQGTGGFNLSSLSAKRTTISSVDVGNDSLRTFGELRYLSSLGVVGYLFLLAALLSKGRKLRRGEIALAVTFLMVNLLLPFYSSSRSDTLVPILATVVMLARYGRKMNWRSVLPPAIALLLIFNTMTDLRSDDSLDTGSVLGLSVLSDFVDNAAISRNFADFSKTSHLIQRVPEDLGWRYGSTIAAYVVAPIPRAVWPGKPLISAGPIIGQKIYKQRRAFGLSTSGIPPGFFGEMYWNFGSAGILLGSPLLGVALGLASRWSKTRQDIRAQVFYGGGLFSTISGFLAVGVGFALLELFTTWVGVQIIYYLLGRPSIGREQLSGSL
ncbi:MAG: O-antigen polymerase [Acidimicrobiales bacterium]